MKMMTFFNKGIKMTMITFQYRKLTVKTMKILLMMSVGTKITAITRAIMTTKKFRMNRLKRINKPM